jgi:hypothetical protein
MQLDTIPSFARISNLEGNGFIHVHRKGSSALFHCLLEVAKVEGVRLCTKILVIRFSRRFFLLGKLGTAYYRIRIEVLRSYTACAIGIDRKKQHS